MKNFTFFVEDDELEVRFVRPSKFERLKTGQAVAGEYKDLQIRLPKREYRTALRALFLHELGHYLVKRSDLNPKQTNGRLKVTEEDLCDLLTWLPVIINDPRNDELRAFLLEEYRDD